MRELTNRQRQEAPALPSDKYRVIYAEVKMIEIKTGDFRELSKGLADDSVDLVLTDPPYGREYLPLWADLGRIAARVLRPGGFLVAYSGQMYLPEVMGMLGAHLRYYWLCALHMPGAGAKIWSRKLRQQAKPALVYSKGKPGKHEWWCDYLVSPNGHGDKKYHHWGQTIAPVKQLLVWYSYPGNLVLDPCIGSGTTAVACLQTGRNCIGYEIDPMVADVARARLASAQLPLPMPVVTQGAMVFSEVNYA